MNFGLGGNERIELAAEQQHLENEVVDDPVNIAREEALSEVRAERKSARKNEERTIRSALKRLFRERPAQTTPDPRVQISSPRRRWN
jgi:hypothetical protein